MSLSNPIGSKIASAHGELTPLSSPPQEIILSSKIKQDIPVRLIVLAKISFISFFNRHPVSANAVELFLTTEAQTVFSF